MTGPIVTVGGVYSVLRSAGSFGLAKILAHQPEADTVYARLFRTRFDQRPSMQDVVTIEPDTLDSTFGVGIGVLPISLRVFEFWGPQLLVTHPTSSVEERDLAYCFGAAVPWDELKYP